MNSDDNIDLADLERELARLSPRRPSEHLEERIARELDSACAAPAISAPRARRRPRLFPLVLGLSACAACVTFLVLASRTPQAPLGGGSSGLASTYTSFTPVSAQSRLVKENFGQPETIDGVYARRVSREYEDTLVWRDPRSSTLVRWTVPREEAAVERLTSL